jgi:hypothetical protein
MSGLGKTDQSSKGRQSVIGSREYRWTAEKVRLVVVDLITEAMTLRATNPIPLPYLLGISGLNSKTQTPCHTIAVRDRGFWPRI